MFFKEEDKVSFPHIEQKTKLSVNDFSFYKYYYTTQ